MEFIEYVPGGLAAAWMVFRMAILFRSGPEVEAPAEPLKPALRLL
ncbi:MAG: hypothetical protein ACJ8GW_00445 [Massilia sp.]